MTPTTRRVGHLMASAPVKCIVSSARVPYYVHTDVLSTAKGSTMDVRLNGSWKQDGEEYLDWTDFDLDTVQCVLNYLYTGDYHCANIACNKDIGIDDSDIAATPEVDLDNRPLTHQNICLPLADRPLTPLSQCLSLGLPEERMTTFAGTLSSKDAELRGYGKNGQAVLTHAKVYVFAHQTLFSELAQFALQRLTQVLVLVDAEDNSLFPGLSDAIRHIYSRTPGQDLSSLPRDPGRNIISQFVALNYPDLTGDNLFELICEGGDFMADVSHKLVRQIRAGCNFHDSLQDQIDRLRTDLISLQVKYDDKDGELREAKEKINGLEASSRGFSKKKKKSRTYGI
ncbi:hypothetical protein EJ05DRAFT_515642 [Pseudovirgaria hyperparasitica]|uniref:BTB domain-containing protein n=1 Tax=Pseudovirgaria hyperparasitica TaxID=470096 RepID=A0A6A6VQP3_9PEZI|nr:uncharacterized protein EJ05DRAFT_515642 [Pseudovirgaria hyperparasitica]KAF2752445.1 hypothetical protein EJ05DRAFT_515642 [Pseudovirgaria hyperparasitica]